MTYQEHTKEMLASGYIEAYPDDDDRMAVEVKCHVCHKATQIYTAWRKGTSYRPTSHCPTCGDWEEF